MKKLLFTFSLLFLSFSIAAQEAIRKGDFLIETGFGFGVENVTTNHTSDSIEANGAVPGLLNLSLGYAISPKFLVNIRMERNGYATAEEDSTRIFSGNFLIGASYVFLNNKSHAMYASLLLGSSKLTIIPQQESEKNGKASYVSNGGGAQLNIGGRVYFSQHVGLNYELGFAGRSYDKFTYTNENLDPEEREWRDGKGTPLDPSDDEAVTLGLSGVNIRIGLAIRF